MAAFDLGGKGQFASRVFWDNSTISLPPNTVSQFLLEYSNTTVTSSTTIYGNATSLSASIASQVNLIELDFPEGGGNYGGFAPYVLANGTNGALLGGVTSFAYPTPYVAVAGLSIFTNSPSAGCPLNPPQFLSSLVIVGGPDDLPNGVGVVTVKLASTYYTPLPAAAAPDDFGFFDLDTESFSAFLASDTSLLSYIPYFKSCSYLTFGIGPPALQIAATALTTTAKTTIKENGPYPTNPPAPGSTVRPSVAPQTTTLPPGSNQGSSDQNDPNQGSPIQDPPNQGASNTEPADTPNPQKGTPSQQGDGSNNPSDQGSGPVDGIPGSGSQGVPGQGSDIPLSVATTKAVVAPAIPYAGTTIQPNEASQYDLPGIGTVSPGGPGVTTNGIVYSLASSATAIISNGITIPITPIGDTSVISPLPSILSFGGTSYTADASSLFVIAGQTVTPAGPAIVVSGTPISIASGATAVVIGTKTVPIVHNPAVDTPTVAPVLKFAGSIYTAGTSSAFVIEGQTLTPGANIEVQGTPISYPSDGSEVIVGSSTEPLSYATITPPVVAPAFTFHGSTYTAGSSSQFIIDGQTLIPGNVITLSGTPISYLSAGTAVVVGTSTEPFSYPQITPSAAVITFDGSTYTADASSAFSIDGQTLSPGHVITVSGTPISYAAARSAVIIGTSTEPLAYAKITPTAKIITFHGSTYTADASSDFIINGQTLVPGHVITVSGTPISYASGGTDVVVGTSTEAVGIGGLIMSGFGSGGGGGVDPANTSVIAFTGGTVQERKWSSVVLGAAVALSFYSALA